MALAAGIFASQKTQALRIDPTSITPEIRTFLEREGLLVGDELANPGRELGRGALGTVNQLSDKYAIKFFAAGTDDEFIDYRALEASLGTSFKTLQLVNKPLVELQAADGRIINIMRLESGGDLAHKRFLTKEELVNSLTAVLCSLSRIAERGMAHGDIKPLNIFLKSLPNGTVRPKIGDLGFCYKINSDLPALDRSHYLTDYTDDLSTQQSPQSKEIFCMGCIFSTILTGIDHTQTMIQYYRNNTANGHRTLMENIERNLDGVYTKISAR